MDNKTEYIICAAIWVQDGNKYVHQPKNVESGFVVAGFRHCNCFVTLFMLYPNREYLNIYVDGFLTSHGRFVKRDKAAEIAYQCCQTNERKKMLCSEDIY
ncbi:MAG: hypothetical protein KQ78_01788 [Candidatus Izimaplasma bacterium HR2]|nr:MAG: hypothetical protein KQ78_01788 [Candidatus Izimaplasma bacterium HR2]